MGKRSNKKRKRTKSGEGEEQNPLGHKQRQFLESLSSDERNSFFDDNVVSPTRRAELWMQQADLGETTVNQYAWATPNEKAMRIIKHFQPIVEVGCGANAYWCQQMKAAGIDVVGYDIAPEKGGIISDRSLAQPTFKVQAGGPEVLTQKTNKRRTLFLCYPDENDGSDDSESMGSSCLEEYTGDIVIHVGELFTDTTLSIDQAPWGRSSSPEFQQRLAAEFHCLLKIALPNWLHTSDTLSVWKRSKTCTIVFAADGEGDDDDEEEEEVKYRHVPSEERLPADVVAPCLAHLVESVSAIPEDSSPILSEAIPEESKGTLANPSPDEAAANDEADYTCPW